MNEENVKIAKLKKSCHAGRIVSKVLCIFFAIGFVASVIGSIMTFSMGKEFDEMIQGSVDRGVIEQTDRVGSVSLFEINLGAVPENIQSDNPAIQAALEDHPASVMYGGYMLALGIAFAIVAVLSIMVGSVFKLIEKENTPFTKKVQKRVTIVMIITSVILFFTTGTPFGLLCGLLTWVVRNVIDYGMTLQTESDETL
jgi:L-cystine uptake protein TcyP (sodium:dicarboxylate symporter family)